MGYHQAGFEIIGVDIVQQRHYPFPFVQADAIEYLRQNWQQFDAIHASPPCQAYSESTKPFRLQGRQYPDLVADTRAALISADKPYVIENVVGAPLHNPTLLCGSMFALQTYRHRLFETSFALPHLVHPPHIARMAKMGRKPKDGEFIQAVGHFADVNFARRAMGIPWMGRDGLAQAVPPAYTRWIGEQLLQSIQQAQAA